MLDDIISGLDANTESRVLEHLTGHNGICKVMGTTVLMTTHTSSLPNVVQFETRTDHIGRHLRYADQVVFINQDGRMQNQEAMTGPDGDGLDLWNMSLDTVDSNPSYTDEQKPKIRQENDQNRTTPKPHKAYGKTEYTEICQSTSTTSSQWTCSQS